MIGEEINAAIFWDIENCRVPTNVSYEEVAGNIRKAVRHHHSFRGAIKLFSVYTDVSLLPKKFRESCQRTGIRLVDVPNGRQDAADRAILVDMLTFAMDNSAPSLIVLISGDVDFSYALHTLGQREYTIMVIRPGGVVSPALVNAGHYVLDWHTVARGGSFVSPKPTVTHLFDSFTSWAHAKRTPDIQTEDKMTVIEAKVQHENPSSEAVVKDVHPNSSLELYRISQSLAEKTNSMSVAAHSFTQSISGQLRSVRMQIRGMNALKRKIKWLIESHGGSLQFVLLCSEYQKKFGKPLYPHDYGFPTVAKLLDKMTDKFILKGIGNQKTICVRSSPNTCEENIPIAAKKKEGITHAKETGIKMFSNLGSSSSVQAKSKDLQSYGLLTETKNEEPKLEAILDDASIEAPHILETPSMIDTLESEKPKLGAIMEHASFEVPHMSDMPLMNDTLESEEPKLGAIIDDASIEAARIVDMPLKNDAIASFNEEAKALIVCYNAISVSNFGNAYWYRYKKTIDYHSLGVENLEQLVEKSKDVKLWRIGVENYIVPADYDYSKMLSLDTLL